MKRSLLVLLSVLALCGWAPYTVQAEDELSAGQTAFNAGQFEEALKHFDASVDASPTNGEPHYWRAKCLISLGRAKEAGGEFRMASMLSTDKTIIEESNAQLKQLKQAVPEQTVDTALKAKKKFVLETRKLDWNLDTSTSAHLQKTLQGQDRELASMIHGRQLLGGAFDGPGVNMDAELRNGPAHAAAITALDRSQLKNTDIVIILDHSGSMGVADCPRTQFAGAASSGGNDIAENRLLWAVEEMTYFSRQITGGLPHGFTFITFDTRPSVFDIKNAPQFDTVLNSLRAGGGTSLTPALDQAYARHSLHPEQPLLIAVVSDCQIDVSDALQSMVAATRRFPLPKGVFITFLQIGIRAEGMHLTDPPLPGMPPDPFFELSHLKAIGAQYDASKLIPFSQVRKEGLAHCILSLLRGSQTAGNSQSVQPVQSNVRQGNRGPTK